jgi:uncharacterized damage-inducible protein DinB
MSIPLTLEELLAYSDAERAKWRAWFVDDPLRLALPFQPGGRFLTTGDLADHIFLVERRHLARLEGSTPPEQTGLAPTDAAGLFDYAALVRADTRQYVSDLDEDRAREAFTFTVQSGTFTMTRRKLLLHMLLHEIRHFAQIAYAARVAGHEPPGDHDIFYFQELL